MSLHSTHYSNSEPPVFALSSQCCVLSGEIANTSFIVFGFDPTRVRNHETFIEYKGEMCASQLDSDDDGHGALGLRVLKRSTNSDHK